MGMSTAIKGSEGSVGKKFCNSFVFMLYYSNQSWGRTAMNRRLLPFYHPSTSERHFSEEQLKFDVR